MEQSLCKLTLVFPPSGSDRVVELMLTIVPPIGGFTTWNAEGHGHGFATASVGERVRGRVKRSVLVAILPRLQADTVLEEIRSKAPILHMTYWIEPVASMGQLVPSQPAARLSVAAAPAPPPPPVFENRP